jgi:hypothetical protein
MDTRAIASEYRKNQWAGIIKRNNSKSDPPVAAKPPENASSTFSDAAPSGRFLIDFVIKDQKASGLSVRAYCKTAGFRENRYYYWQKRLRELACEEIMNPMQATESGMVPKGWSACSLVSPVATPMVAPDFLPMQAVALGETKGEAINQNTITIEIGKCRVGIQRAYFTLCGKTPQNRRKCSYGSFAVPVISILGNIRNVHLNPVYDIVPVVGSMHPVFKS